MASIFHVTSGKIVKVGWRLFCSAMVLMFLVFPGTAALGETEVSGSISEDTRWSLSESPYIVTGDVTVEAGVTLTVNSGVQVKFNNGFSLSVSGTLNASGTSVSQILFTSNQSTPFVSDWGGIRFNDNSGGSLSNCVVEYADIGIYMYRNTSPQITGCTIRHNNIGVKLSIYYTSDQPGTVVNNCSLYENTEYNYYVDSGRDEWNKTLDATDNWWGTSDPSEIAESVYDYADNSEMAAVDFSSFLDREGGSPMVSPAGETYLVGGTYDRNVMLDGAYLVPSYFSVWTNQVNVAPGTTIRFMSGAYFSVSGGAKLVAGDSSGSQVTFTSGETMSVVGDWGGIRFNDNSGGSLSNCVVEYADIGIYMYRNTSPQITGCTIRHNNIGVKLSIYYTSDQPGTVVNNCSLYENTEYNYYVDSGRDEWNKTLDVTNNWWGTADPLEIAATIHDYEDNSKMAVVNFTPFLDADGNPPTPGTTAPDLIIQNRNAIPTSLKAGSEISVSCDVKNQGDASSPASTIKYYLSADATYDSGDMLLGTESVDTLPVSGTSSETAALTIPSGISPGTWHILFRADADGEVPESDEGNNLSYDEITITSDPPPPPTSLDARSGIDSIRLTWESALTTYIAGYDVYRSESAGGPWDKISTEPVTGEEYEDTSALIVGTTYHYHLKALDTFGNESGTSDTASAVFGQVKLFIPDAKGESGKRIRLPVNIANADGLRICGVDVYMTYNPDVLSAENVEKTALSSEYAWAPNLETQGIARAVIASSEGKLLYGDGSLFYILFEVKGNEGDSSDLQFQISNTSLCKCGDDYTPVAVDLDLTDIGTFTVGKNHTMGDLNGDGKVDSADVVITLNIAVGNIEPTEEQENAGDVSGDNRIRSNDAALILRIAAGLPLAPESSKGKRNNLRSSSVSVSIPDNLTVPTGGSIWVPIEIDNAANVMGADIILNYHPSLFTATDCRTTSMTENFDKGLNLSQAGQVRISLSAMGGDGLFQRSGMLAEVQFAAQANASGTSPLTLASVRLNDTYSRDFATSALQTDVKTISGSLRIKDFNLDDAILVLKILTGTEDASGFSLVLNADKSGKVGMEDVILILQDVAGISEK